jgi:hypothetical protein
MMRGPTGVYLLGRSFDHYLKSCKRDQDLLEILDHHTIIIDEHGYEALFMERKFSLGARIKVLANCLIYADPWGCAHYGAGKLWEHGPGHYDQPIVTIGGKTYLYRFDDNHVRLFKTERENQLKNYLCLGLFTDDMGFHFHSSNCDQGEKALDSVWPEWRRGKDWNQRRIQYLEYMLTGICMSRGKLHMINGSRRVGEHTLSFWEGYGPQNSETDYPFWTTASQLSEKGRPGDFAFIRCLDAEGNLALDDEVVAELLRIAWGLDMVAGISFLEYPADDRGSKRSYYETYENWPENLRKLLV